MKNETFPLKEEKLIQAQELHDLRESFFLAVIFDELTKTFEDDLEEVGAEEDDVRYFQGKLSKKTEEEILGILSLPYELRKSFFEMSFKKFPSGNDVIDDILMRLSEAAKKYGYTLGYHVSEKDIKPGKGGNWNIEPTEFDDRDEMKMAYYSIDYDSIYRKKPAKFLYFVRSETGESSSHKRDTSNRWGRATSLSIVARVSLLEVDQKVREMMEEEREKNKERRI